MVKLIVLDVDGVLVGHKTGVNFPHPNQKAIEALKKVREKGIPVVLCTGKIYHAVDPIVQKANLNNPHIANTGALIFNPQTNEFKSFSLDKNLVQEIISLCLQNNLYFEVYFEDDYLIKESSSNEVAARRIRILQKDPVIVKSPLEDAEKLPINKITIIAMDEQERKRIEKLLQPYQNQLTFTWTINPSTNPWEYCLMTSPTVSKIHALKEVANELGISLEDALGVGDTLGDWIFMEPCGYVATMEDASEKLKELVESKENHLIAPSVDDDGILQILNYFLQG